jgi:predicted ATPase
VELAPLSDSALVPQQMATSLGLRDEPGQPIIETLTAYLRNRQVLLVLDNCEHLLAACAQLADSLLRACPRVRLLASSREPLGVAGEAVFSVPSLSFPDPDHLPPVDQMTDYVAVSLFIDRARLVLPDYQVAAHNAAALARICQRLDGIPLPIEMAAARLNILNADQLAGRLDDAFRVLTGGSRSALPRQQTLRATIDWSYQLLNEQERRLLQRLSVFAGGCTLAAAEAVCADVNLPPADILDRLASLVAKSLVLANRQPGDEPRYRLLETVRQYAREKLNDSGDSAPLHTRHRDYFLLFFETNAPKLASAERLLWIRRLKADRDNLRQALQWSFDDASNVEAGPRLLIACIYLRGTPAWSSYFEYVAWCQRGVAWCESQNGVSAELFAHLLSDASWVMIFSDQQLALVWSKKAVEISRRLGSAGRQLLRDSLNTLALRYWEVDEPELAQAADAEAQALFQEIGPDNLSAQARAEAQSWATHKKADIANAQGKHQEAKRLLDESLQLLTASDDPFNRFFPLRALGYTCVQLREYDEARQHFHAAQFTTTKSSITTKSRV